MSAWYASAPIATQSDIIALSFALTHSCPYGSLLSAGPQADRRTVEYAPRYSAIRYRQQHGVAKLKVFQVELIPRERYLVFFLDDDGEQPNAVSIEELKLVARLEQDTEVLGAEQLHQGIISFVEAIATGLIANTIWEKTRAARKFIEDHRKSTATSRATESEFIERSTQAVQSTLGHIIDTSSVAVTITREGERGIEAVFQAQVELKGNRHVEIRSDPALFTIQVSLNDEPSPHT